MGRVDYYFLTVKDYWVKKAAIFAIAIGYGSSSLFFFDSQRLLGQESCYFFNSRRLWVGYRLKSPVG